VAQTMQENGFEHVQVLKGGWKAWQEEGYPTVPK
jgi:3-mercaptopyruvate sulfurtransferase SseA